MTLLLLVLWCQVGIVLTELVLQEDFVLIASNKKWTGFDIKTMELKSLIQCTLYCRMDSECYSFNYITGSHADTCELKSGWCLDSSRASLVADSNSVHYAVKGAKFGKYTGLKLFLKVYP